MRWMATTVLACIGAACTVDAQDQADGGICVGSACPAGTDASEGTEGGFDDGSSGPLTTGIDPDGAGPCASDYAACIEEGFEQEICADMLAECEMNGSSSSDGEGGRTDTGSGPPGDDRCRDTADCCAENGGSASVCSGIVDTCHDLDDCDEALGDCYPVEADDQTCADAHQACRDDACAGLVDACRPPEADPFAEPCADAFRRCGMYVHGCVRIFGTPTPQEFCESSIPDAEFCQAWIIVCEERRVACDELLASSAGCSVPGASCHDAWRACVEDSPAFGPCWDAFATCEGSPPDCPEADGPEHPGKPCTCVDHLQVCLDAEDVPEDGGSCDGHTSG